MSVTIRAAAPADVDDLVELRRELAFEGIERREQVESEGFEETCRAFLRQALAGSSWQIWVAVADERIVANVYVALVDKVPRPEGEATRIAYLTNVYTRPEQRGNGIGARLVERAQQAARETDCELMLVWPSDQSGAFYERLGFIAPGEPLVWYA